jgi:hypothetical protein
VDVLIETELVELVGVRARCGCRTRGDGGGLPGRDGRTGNAARSGVFNQSSLPLDLQSSHCAYSKKAVSGSMSPWCQPS